jgi:hypothetical protein
MGHPKTLPEREYMAYFFRRGSKKYAVRTSSKRTPDEVRCEIVLKMARYMTKIFTLIRTYYPETLAVKIEGIKIMVNV